MNRQRSPLAWFLLSLLLTLAAGMAFAEPPDNRPPDNRPPDKTAPPPVMNDLSQLQDQMQDQMQDQLQKQDQLQDQQQSQTSSSNNNIDIDDEKQAPGLGLSTAPGSTGLGITTPIGGFMVNLPWSFGDRKILSVCDRMVGTLSWPKCMCTTKTLRGMFDDSDVCEAGLAEVPAPPPPK